MKAQFIGENLNFERGLGSKAALEVGSYRLKNTESAQQYVISKAHELTMAGLPTTFHYNEYNDGIFELQIEGLYNEGIMISFLTYDNMDWQLKDNKMWGWGIWEQDEGEVILEAGLDWEKIENMIPQLLKDYQWRPNY